MSAALHTGWFWAFFSSMGFTGLITLVDFIAYAEVRALNMIVIWVMTAISVASALGLLRQAWRRTPTNLRRIESALRERVEGYPPISAMLARGYRIRMETLR